MFFAWLERALLCGIIQEMIPECILNGLKVGNKEDGTRIFSQVHNERQGATDTTSNKENFGETVELSILKIFKIFLDKTVSMLLQFWN